jgi:hypothetical protein
LSFILNQFRCECALGYFCWWDIILSCVIPNHTTWNSKTHSFYCWCHFYVMQVSFAYFCLSFVLCFLGSDSCLFLNELYFLGLDMVYHSEYCYVLCYMCGDNDGCRRQHMSAWQKVYRLNVSSLAICPCYLHWIVEGAKNN